MATESMSTARRAGVLFLQMNGETLDAMGEFSVNLGKPKREAMVGADRVHGFRETPQVPQIEGAITLKRGLNVEKLLEAQGATITLKFGPGEMYVLRDAWFAGDGNIVANESKMEIVFQGLSAKWLT